MADDTGFISIGWDQALFFWKLDQPEPVWTYKKGNTVDFNCLTSYKAEKSEGPNDKNEPFIYVTGNDKSIRELKGFQKNPNNKDGLPEGTLKK